MNWQNNLFKILKSEKIKIFSYVPDAGHKILINNAIEDNLITAVPLTSEEEGIGIAAGSYLGGLKAVLLMQSSGVGNCINQLSLINHGQFPFLTIVTMRGEFGEGNPWQYAMGQAVVPALNSIGINCLKIDSEYDVDNSGNILDNIIKKRVNILFINVKPITPKREKWDECKQNIERFWNTIPGNFYILFDFSDLSILPPTYIRDWISLFQYNDNINVDKIPGSMMIIKTGILRKALKYYLSQWKPDVPIFAFKKFGSADAKIIYYFDDLVLLAQPSFPDKFAWLLTNAIIKGEKELIGATSPLDIRKISDIHPGALMALNNEKMPELTKK